jgi:small subunit ribosomal protein S7
MPRKKRVFRKQVHKDIKFDDHIVERLVTKLMMDGKKNVARQVVYKTFDQLSEKFKDDPVKVFKKALSNIKPPIKFP